MNLEREKVSRNSKAEFRLTESRHCAKTTTNHRFAPVPSTNHLLPLAFGFR